MKKENKKNINRRSFLKTLGVGAAVSTTAFYGCNKEQAVSVAKVLGEVPTDKMTYRINPHTGDRVSLLGYGCMRWPLRNREDGQEEVDQEAVNELVDYAIAHGVNYFDTAPRYIRGWSEKATGIALSRHPRDKYFIATKMSNQGNDPYTLSFEGSVAMYKQSMKDLQVDYIDYYLLHSIGGGGMESHQKRFYDNGLLDFLLEERRVGRIRNLGFSYHGDIAVFDHLLEKDIQWDFVMIQLNYVDWHHASGANTNAEYLYGELLKRNIPAIIMEPLLGGRLSRLNAHAQGLLKQIRPDDSPANWAFRHAGTYPNVLTVLSGMTYMEHLQENIRAYSPLEPLNEEEYEALDKVTELILRSDFIQCTQCQYCMPCPHGIDIPGVFAHYNKCLTEEKISENSQDPNYRKNRRAFLTGYDRKIAKIRQADHCTSCDECLSECPQRINIPKEMRRINEYAELLKQEKEF